MKKDKKQEISLHFDGSTSPNMTAKDESKIAEQIINTAKKHGIHLQKEEELTALLAKVQLNAEIPPKLYLAVAQLLTLFYFLDSSKPAAETVLE